MLAFGVVLQLLQARYGMGLWMVTRAAGSDQVVLAARSTVDSGYDVKPGTSLSWDGSLCAAMVAGHGPTVAPQVEDVPAYATAAKFEADRGRHLNAPGWFVEAGLYGFAFRGLRPVPFVACPGSTSFFEVEGVKL